MKYVVLLFWAIILGQVVGYITASLAATPLQPVLTLVLSVFIALAVITIVKVGMPKDTPKTKE
jgi:uncharacterized membrane protein